MTVHDGHRLADALDDLSERALTPAVMLGDSHYGSSDNMALTREQNTISWHPRDRRKAPSRDG